MREPAPQPTNREERPWLGMVFVWFFFNFGFVNFFLTLLAWTSHVRVSFGTAQNGLNGYVWMTIGCFMLGLFFAAPRARR